MIAARSALDHARDYVEHLAPVLKLRPRDKRPATAHGKDDATLDRTTVETWFGRPGANIGVRTGAAEQLLVLDVDPRNGGIESLAAFERAHGKLPHTARVATGGGGDHFYFKLPPGVDGLHDRPSFAGYNGLDIKCGGYVVAPPSVHPSGGTYEWVVPLSDLSDAPAFLLDYAKGKKRVAKVSTSSAPYPEGSRNSRLFRIGSRLVGQGMSEEGIRAALFAENRDKCDPPLDDDEVAGIARSVMRYDPNDQHPFSDLGNARRLVELADGKFRYESSLKAWFYFTGQ